MNKYDYKQMVNDALQFSIKADCSSYEELAESMKYSLLAGGKRLRPILLLEFCRISGGDPELALPAACAIEMIHTYSLIHDDLPCMDNDELRRGVPTNHVKYGECTATLAGDALQAAAYEILAKSCLSPDAKCNCIKELSISSGLNGMCGGQYLDMLFEGTNPSVDELNLINVNKTGALISAACKMGVCAAGGTDEQIAAAEKFGRCLGLAFQIRDDVLDVIGSEAQLGKPIGSDLEENKNTYMTLMGLEECSARIKKLTDEAKSALITAFSDTDYLNAVADVLVDRVS